MAKRKKRAVTTRKKKDDDDEVDDTIEEPAKKKVTSQLEDEMPHASSFNVESSSIGKSDNMGSEFGFSSHFWCNYCEFSSDTKKELVTHMRQHMAKCSYCTFSSLSRAEIAKHVKCEHAEEAEKTICEVDSSSSSTEHDMDKDPCSACIFCDFMTYSTEHLEKHTTSKHQGMLPKSVAKMISKQVSARIRRADALFYCTISSDYSDKAEVDSVVSGTDSEVTEDKGPILIEPDECGVDVKPTTKDLKIQPPSPSKAPEPDVKPNTFTLSKPAVNDQKPVVSEEPKESTKPVDWKVKVETLYCLSCPYSNVAIEKLKCHALAQHPLDAAAASFNSEGACRLQDITFFCVREGCSHTNVQCSEFEEHLISCCSSKDSLLFGENERLKATVEFILKFKKKEGIKQTDCFLEFISPFVNTPQSNDSTLSDSSSLCQTPLAESANKYEKSFATQSIIDAQTTNQPNRMSISLPGENLHQQIASFQNNFNSSMNNFSPSNSFNQPQILPEQPRQPEIIPVLGEEANMSGLSTSFTGGPNVESSHHMPVMQQEHHLQSGMMNTNFSGPPPLENTQVDNSSHMNNNFEANTNPMATSFNNGIYNKDPTCFNSNVISSGQQNVYPQSAPNADTMNTFNSSFPLMPGQSSQPFPSVQSDQQFQEPVLSRMNAAMPTTNSQALKSASLFSDVQHPKMLDLLTGSHSILLDDDLDIQPWPVTHNEGAPGSQSSPANALPPVTQQSLCTPPLPQQSFSSHENPSMFTPSFDTGPQPFSSFPHSDVSMSTQQNPPPMSTQFSTTQPSHNQSQLPVHNTGPQTPVIDSSSPAIGMNTPQIYAPQPNVAPQPSSQSQNSTLTPDKNAFQGVDQTPSGSLSMGDNSSACDSNYSTEQATNVPNFLVPSSASVSSEPSPNQQQSNSFFNNSVPPQSPNHQPIPSNMPATPPNQNPRFNGGNSPLSPSIYLSGKAPRHQRSTWTKEPMMPRGISPQFRMRGPPPQVGFNNPSPHVRQRLFSPIPSPGRGRPRGPRVHHQMMRPPMNSGDDDVIVTAVVRGPPPPRPPMPPRGRGLSPRGAVPRGRGGAFPRGGLKNNIRAPPPHIPNNSKRPIDVSRHFVDLACVVNANEEGDEIQIVGVTPGKGGNSQPKAVDAKQFSYCCIHCGKDQGSKQVMKQHIKSSHSDSLLGAFRNTETGQWLYFCPQLTCEFMTYDENRLTDHLFSCYNLDRTKQLPFDMQSALRNLKSLKIRQVNNVQGGIGRSQTNPIDLDGQGLRDTFNNNLKDAFDDMVENTIGRQMVRPNQIPPLRPPEFQPSYASQRGAIRGPYPTRGPPPQSMRQRAPRPRGMPPGYRQRIPRQPRYPYPAPHGMPRAPGQPPQPRGMPPFRGGAPRGQRPPNRGFMPRPNYAGMPGNEQSPIVIDLDADSPEKAPETENTSGPQTPVTTTVSSSMTNFSQNEPMTDYTQTLASLNSNHDVSLPLPTLPDGDTATSVNQDQVNITGAIPVSSCQSDIVRQNELPISKPVDSPSVRSLQPEGSQADTISTTTSSSSDGDITSSNPVSTTTDPQSASATTSSTDQVSSSQSNPMGVSTSVRDIPSPSQLLSEMNALSRNPMGQKQPTPNVSQEGTPGRESQEGKDQPMESNPPQSPDDNDEEQINTILLDKVFAKVPHMPKKLSQRLVLKFKKYAADRGVIITRHSKVIDEFVSKISYKGSHAPPAGGQAANSDGVQPAQTTVTNSVQQVNRDNPPQPTVAGSQPSQMTTAEIAPTSNSNQSGQSSSCSSTLTPQSSNTDVSRVSASSSSNNKDSEVIVPQRNIQFSGTFAHIVRGSVQSKAGADKNLSTAEDKSETMVQDSPPGPVSSAVEPQLSGAKNTGVSDSDTINEMVLKSLKKEIVPISFPSGSKDDSIEVKSSVDHLICGHASLEVDIAGKPLSSTDFNEDKTIDSSTKMSGGIDEIKSALKTVNKDSDKISFLDQSSGRLILKVKKSSKPRLPNSQNSIEEYSSEGNDDSNHVPMEDSFRRRSERKRKMVKVDYEPDEMNEMDELMSDDDDEYHVESDDDYNGSDSDGNRRKRVKKSKGPLDPTAFELSTKGCFGCWQCSKKFSRVMFVKRHIVTKHKSGLCAILLTETDAPPSEQPSLLLFCPQNCKYVTSDPKAFSSHIRSCSSDPLGIEGVDYTSIQEIFFATEFKKLVDGIASGAISTKIPKGKSLIQRKKTPAPPPPSADQGSGGPNVVVTTAIVHAPPRDIDSHHVDYTTTHSDSSSNRSVMTSFSREPPQGPPSPHGFPDAGTGIVADPHNPNLWDPSSSLAGLDEHFHENSLEENYDDDFNEEYLPYEEEALQA